MHHAKYVIQTKTKMKLPSKKILKTYRKLEDLGISNNSKREYLENSYSLLGKICFMPKILNYYIKKIEKKNLPKKENKVSLENLFWGFSI